MKKTRSELLPGTLDMLVLKTLTIGPMHGYAIVRSIQSKSDEVLQVEEGTLYPALHRMHRKGWIEASWGLSESNRRAKYYSLTRSGRSRLKVVEREWENVSAAVSRVLGAQAEGA